MLYDSTMAGRESVDTNPVARVGSTVGGRWRLDELLGVGAASAVYRATHRNGNEVAIRILHGPAAKLKEIRADFARNIASVNEIKQLGILPILDDGRAEDGAPFVVMELLEGEHLEQRRVRLGGKLPVYEVLEFTDDLLDTLIAAHAQRIVHGGIRPAHLFYASDGRMLVLDFGLVAARAAAGPELDPEAPAVAAAASFLAPEQLTGEPGDVDEQTDVWAAGATMFALLTGRSPIEPGDRNKDEAVRGVASVEPSLDPAVVALVDKALKRDPRQRWQSAEDMSEALHATYEKLYRRPMELPDPPPAHPSAPSASPPPGKTSTAPAVPSPAKTGTAKPAVSLPPGPPPPRGSQSAKAVAKTASAPPAATAAPAAAAGNAQSPAPAATATAVAAAAKPAESPAAAAAPAEPAKRASATAEDLGRVPASPPAGRTVPMAYAAGAAAVALVAGIALGYGVAPRGARDAAASAATACPERGDTTMPGERSPAPSAAPEPAPAGTAQAPVPTESTASIGPLHITATAGAAPGRESSGSAPKDRPAEPKATGTAKSEAPPAASSKFVPSDI